MNGYIRPSILALAERIELRVRVLENKIEAPPEEILLSAVKFAIKEIKEGV